MPEFFLELFSEEIPARMQAAAAERLAMVVMGELRPLSPREQRVFSGPRRIALAADVQPTRPSISTEARGPRLNAPAQAVTGFLRKHDAREEDLRAEGDYWVLRTATREVPASTLIAETLPAVVRGFAWPKSMRWGSSNLSWVRPLRRIVCLLDGEVVRFDLRAGGDDGHGLASADLTEGHRFLSPGAFPVGSCADWQAQLRARHVLVNAAERRSAVADGIAALAAEKGLSVADDPGLLDEVTGLVEWPVPLLGRIDQAYMDLPPEVMQVSMRVHLRYFALRTETGAAAPWFAFVANVAATDGGAAIVAGNERVLRARFADARHFWNLDRRAPLASRLPLLDHVTFHAKLGSQGARIVRLARLARLIAPTVGASEAMAERAAHLAKADLVTGMVGEFPELQGVMGRYYALHDGEPREVADAVRDHYAPRGPGERAPAAPVSIAVALADKLDQLAAFFAIGERPTGSGDPYALRRAALGVIRIVRENGIRLHLASLIEEAGRTLDYPGVHPAPAGEVMGFLLERLRVQLRAEGARYDVLDAVLGAGADDDLIAVLARAEDVARLLGTADGANLLTAYRRAANILRIEDRKDGPHQGAVNPEELEAAEEQALARALDRARRAINGLLGEENYAAAMAAMAGLRAPLDAFFERVTVNAPEPALRRNRLRLLSCVRATMDGVADFSRIEG